MHMTFLPQMLPLILPCYLKTYAKSDFWLHGNLPFLCGFRKGYSPRLTKLLGIKMESELYIYQDI